MKTIGILGGMSAASTQIYYTLLTEGTQARLGGLHGPGLLIRSVDFAPIAAMQAEGAWDALGARLYREAQALVRGGAEIVILATNTMHKVAGAMMEGVDAKFIHIAEATAKAVRGSGHARPAVMATSFTMEEAFYTDVLRAHGLEPVLPGPEDRALTPRII